MDTIRVKCHPKLNEGLPEGASKVGLWEVDAAHPEGEVYVAGDVVVEVAETPGVLQALKDDRLVKVGGSSRSADREDEKPVLTRGERK